MSDMIEKEGFDFVFDPNACETCEGNCCTGESGYIWVQSNEINEISNFLKIDTESFMKNCLKKVKYRYSIKEIFVNGSYQCLFFDKDKGCEIYPVRPKQCRTYPFWDHFKENTKEVKKECPGIFLKKS
ncbi:YkgJ family cysteine cluster protein [Nitrosophilus alvini]|uniref:YkgJ family cysteine cluster protein n=1 Tax=Nitrosophilus alvini TaxID=2714855 RepID=UPI00190C8AC5|nr:YkgJ family cysteine cluster protein [Nitrosophilus alvini]